MQGDRDAGDGNRNRREGGRKMGIGQTNEREGGIPLFT